MWLRYPALGLGFLMSCMVVVICSLPSRNGHVVYMWEVLRRGPCGPLALAMDQSACGRKFLGVGVRSLVRRPTQG